MEWVDHLDFETVHETNIEKWQPGTGLWLLENVAFKVWLQEHGKPLWCHGMRKALYFLSPSIVTNVNSWCWQDHLVVRDYIHLNCYRR